jgi:homoserine dehydrogenase
VLDRPGVLSAIAGHLGKEGISIASVLQKEGFPEKGVPVIILTHAATKKNLFAALSDIEKMEYVKDRTQVIRIED